MAGKQRNRERVHIGPWWTWVVRVCCAGGLMGFVFAIILFVMAGRTLSQSEQLAYVERMAHRQHVYLLDLRHGVRHALSSLAGQITHPVWSPDGLLLAYVDRDTSSSSMDSSLLRVVDVGRGSDHTFVTNANSDSQLSWAPDSRRIAFVRNVGLGYDIFFADLSGGSVHNLTNDMTSNRMPAWSPDGARIAYVQGYLGDIWIMDIDSGYVRNLTADPSADSAPAWSPDGTHLAFISNRSGKHELYVMNATGEHVRRLTGGTVARVSPMVGPGIAWSPDGREIAFVASLPKQQDLFVAAVDGSYVRQLTDTASGVKFITAEGFSWSADSRWIVFVGRMDDQRDIFMVGREGSPVYQLTAFGGLEMSPAWRP
jgi:Tol biopolymer transport system component